MTRCQPVTFTDDEGNEHTILAHARGTLTDEDRAGLIEIARAALRRHAATPPCPNTPACEHDASFHRDGACVVRFPNPCGCGSSS